jgi:dipeptidyl aminopeptidase/acylaminoacyl peptidase
VNEQRLRDALRQAPIEDAGARARALRVVRAAYREREPARRGRRWAPIVAVACTLVVAVVVAAAVSAPGDAVARWVRTVLGVGHEDAKPALVRVPGGGRLLATSAGGAWVVSPDGSRRRLGDYDGASWSPHGRFAVVWRISELTAVEPGGGVRWSLPAARPIRVARWGPVDGFRIAYVSGSALRIVNGDGTGDHWQGRARPGVAPAWRPDDRHVLAYVDGGNRVRVVAVDSGRLLWRTRPVPGIRELAWSPDGDRMLVATRRQLLVHARTGGLVARRELPPGLVADDIAWSPRGDRIAVVRRDAKAGRSEVVVVSADAAVRQGHDDLATGPNGRARLLFSGSGRFGAVAWSPDGRRLLVPWPDADQWLFLGGRTSAVGNIARQFGPRAGRPTFAGAVEWCCAAP